MLEAALVVLLAVAAHSGDVPLRAGARLSDMKSLRAACSLLVPTSRRRRSPLPARSACSAPSPLGRPSRSPRDIPARARQGSYRRRAATYPRPASHRQQQRCARELAAIIVAAEQGRARANLHARATSVWRRALQQGTAPRALARVALRHFEQRPHRGVPLLLHSVTLAAA